MGKVGGAGRAGEVPCLFFIWPENYQPEGTERITPTRMIPSTAARPRDKECVYSALI